MEQLSQLLEALLASLAVVGAAAIHMLLLIWIIFAAFIVIALLRWASVVAYHAGVAAYHRGKRR